MDTTKLLIKTQQEYDDTMSALQLDGYKWETGELPTEVNKFKEDTVMILQCNGKTIYLELRVGKGDEDEDVTIISSLH